MKGAEDEGERERLGGLRGLRDGGRGEDEEPNALLQEFMFRRLTSVLSLHSLGKDPAQLTLLIITTLLHIITPHSVHIHNSRSSPDG